MLTNLRFSIRVGASRDWCINPDWITPLLLCLPVEQSHHPEAHNDFNLDITGSWALQTPKDDTISHQPSDWISYKWQNDSKCGWLGVELCPMQQPFRLSSLHNGSQVEACCLQVLSATLLSESESALFTRYECTYKESVSSLNIANQITSAVWFTPVCVHWHTDQSRDILKTTEHILLEHPSEM